MVCNESSTTSCRQAAAAGEKEAVIETEKELEAAAAVRRAAFYSDPSSPSREVCGKYIPGIYAMHKLPADRIFRAATWLWPTTVASAGDLAPVPRRRSVVRRAHTRR